MIRFENISKAYGPIQALDNVSFDVEPAAITILAGADGAGKSTLFKISIGLTKKDSGRIGLSGKDLPADPSRLTAITGYMPERFSLYLDLTVEENMNFFADIHGVPRERRENLKKKLLEKTGMWPFKNRRAGALSGGMKQKLALSTILLASPTIIILDEPTTGVDPLSRLEFFDIIQELKAEGKTILIATPYLDEAEKGDVIVFIKGGKIIKKAGIGELKKYFPARLFRIEPAGNIFEIMQKIERLPELKNSVYLRGKYLKYLQEGDRNFLNLIPHRQVKEEKPTLEDIYIYYERTATNHGQHH